MITEASVEAFGRSVELSVLADDHIGRLLAERGRWYEEDLLAAIAILAPVGTYVDVGAYVGTHSAFFSTFCPADRVVAIEPNPDAYEVLTLNARRFGFEAHQLAIHDSWQRCGLAKIDPDNRGRVSICRGDRTPACRLDALGLDDVGLIKIDVEGAERRVVASALETIAATRPIVAVETETPGGVDELLVPYGYERTRRYCATPTFLWIAR